MSVQTEVIPHFTGQLISPDDAGYEGARRVYNGVVDNRPAVIARCTRPQDVQAALTYARDQGLVVACAAVATPSRASPAATTAS